MMSGKLNHSPAVILQKLLINLSQVTHVDDQDDWPCYTDNMPDTPNNCICITNTAGRIQGRSHIDGEIQEQHGVQIRIRSEGNDGYQKGRDLIQALDTLIYQDSVVLNDSTYEVQAFTRTSDCHSLGREPSSRRMAWTINGIMDITMTVDGDDIGTGT